MRHLIPISGKDSLTTAIVQRTHEPEKEYEYFYNFVGAEPPEVLHWLNKIESYIGAPIKLIGSDLESIIYGQGILPMPRVRYCTRMAKIQPMQEYVGDDAVTLYYGIRYDEDYRDGYTPRENETVRYPLIEHKIDINAVYSILNSLDLEPPSFFWKSLFHLVAKMLGDDAYLLHKVPSHILKIWFAWRSRPNCTFCFFQRLYEFVGLLEHHPKLYWEASRIESEVGAEGYTWLQNTSLKELAGRAKEVKLKRARQIIKMLYQYLQLSLFSEQDNPQFAGTTCGVFCGK